MSASTRKIELPMMLREARFAPSTVDEQARTVELTWTTGATVRRRGFFSGDWDEELSLKDSAVRLDRLNNGASLLDSHDAYQLASVIGVVEKAWLQGRAHTREGRATVRFSERAEVEPIWRDVQAGIIRNVSVGYAIHRVETIERDKDVPLMRVVDWEPMELSLVAVPADRKAQVRADENRQYPCVVERMTTMTKDTSQASGEVAQEQPGEDDEVERREEPKKRAKAAARKGDPAETPDEPNARADEPASPAPGVSEDEVERRVQARIREERDRVERIEQMCRALRIDKDIGQRLIKDGVSADDAWKACVAEADRRDRATAIVERSPRIEAGEQDEDTIRGKAIRAALLNRFDSKAYKLEFGGERFTSMSLLEIGRHCLESAGVRVYGMSKSDLARQALMPGYGVRAGGMHTTSDFANILADVANKTLRDAYDQAPRTFTPFTRRVTLPDFKNANRTQFGEAPQMQLINEHGEFTRGTMGDAKETYALKTYGRMFAITRETLINDDLDAFTRAPQLFGMSAAQKESDIVWATITSGETVAMGDGTVLFHANHGNLKSSGSGAPAVATVGAARAAMRVQKGLDGVTLINVQPAYLIVPAALETVAEQFLSATLVPQTTATVVPERMRSSLTLVVEPRLDAASTTAWYLAASPMQIDTIEYAYLEGQEGVMIETRAGWDVDGVEIKARMDFAAKPIDWRGLYKDVGTA